MKIRSIKGIALSMVLATMSAASLEAFHHHSDHCCTIPFPDASVYIDPAVIA